MIKHKITIKNILRHLTYYVGVMIAVIMFISLQLTEPYEYSWAIVYVFCSLLLVYSVLTIYLFLEYFFFNRGDSIYFDPYNKVLKYYRKSKEVIIKSCDVKQIEYCQSKFYNGKAILFPTDSYHFCKIVLNDNTYIIITSLLYPNFDFGIEELKVVRKRLVASIYL